MELNETTVTGARAAFDSAARPWSAVLAAVAPERWDDPSPCPGWSGRDVAAHLISSERDFFADRGFPLPASPVPTEAVPTDPVEAWRAHAASVDAALADPTITAAEYDGWFGPTTVGASFEQFCVWDLLVHRWDLARACGVDTTSDDTAAFTDAELDRIEAGIPAFGEALYLEGICLRPLDVPADADRTARTLALVGRRA